MWGNQSWSNRKGPERDTPKYVSEPTIARLISTPPSHSRSLERPGIQSQGTNGRKHEERNSNERKHDIECEHRRSLARPGIQVPRPQGIRSVFHDIDPEFQDFLHILPLEGNDCVSVLKSFRHAGISTVKHFMNVTDETIHTLTMLVGKGKREQLPILQVNMILQLRRLVSSCVDTHLNGDIDLKTFTKESFRYFGRSWQQNKFSGCSVSYRTLRLLDCAWQHKPLSYKHAPIDPEEQNSNERKPEERNYPRQGSNGRKPEERKPERATKERQPESPTKLEERNSKERELAANDCKIRVLNSHTINPSFHQDFLHLLVDQFGIDISGPTHEIILGLQHEGITNWQVFKTTLPEEFYDMQRPGRTPFESIPLSCSSRRSLVRLSMVVMNRIYAGIPHANDIESYFSKPFVPSNYNIMYGRDTEKTPTRKTAKGKTPIRPGKSTSALDLKQKNPKRHDTTISTPMKQTRSKTETSKTTASIQTTKSMVAPNSTARIPNKKAPKKFIPTKQTATEKPAPASAITDTKLKDTTITQTTVSIRTRKNVAATNSQTRTLATKALTKLTSMNHTCDMTESAAKKSTSNHDDRDICPSPPTTPARPMAPTHHIRPPTNKHGIDEFPLLSRAPESRSPQNGENSKTRTTESAATKPPITTPMEHRDKNMKTTASIRPTKALDPKATNTKITATTASIRPAKNMVATNPPKTETPKQSTGNFPSGYNPAKIKDTIHHFRSADNPAGGSIADAIITMPGTRICNHVKLHTIGEVISGEDATATKATNSKNARTKDTIHHIRPPPSTSFKFYDTLHGDAANFTNLLENGETQSFVSGPDVLPPSGRPPGSVECNAPYGGDIIVYDTTPAFTNATTLGLAENEEKTGNHVKMENATRKLAGYPTHDDAINIDKFDVLPPSGRPPGTTKHGENPIENPPGRPPASAENGENIRNCFDTATEECGSRSRENGENLRNCFVTDTEDIRNVTECPSERQLKQGIQEIDRKLRHFFDQGGNHFKVNIATESHFASATGCLPTTARPPGLIQAITFAHTYIYI